MVDDEDMQKEIRKLREEVSELRKMVNLLLGMMMEEDEESPELEDVTLPVINKIYN